MAEFKFTDIFRKAFGYEAPKNEFAIPVATKRTQYSSLVQPYYDIDDLGREHFLPVRINNYLIPFAVVGIQCKKTLVETPMPERGGSVTEMISIDDYIINIKGILINKNNDYPEKEIINIQKLFKINASLPLRSALTDIFLNGAYNHQVIIKDVKWPATGNQHAKAFEMDCKSDMIFNLEIE